MNNVERYLITGSTGFVGRRLLGLLNTSKCKIKLLARQLDPNYETIVCNLGNDKIPLSALESVDTVFHLAESKFNKLISEHKMVSLSHDIKNRNWEGVETLDISQLKG